MDFKLVYSETVVCEEVFETMFWKTKSEPYLNLTRNYNPGLSSNKAPIKILNYFVSYTLANSNQSSK